MPDVKYVVTVDSTGAQKSIETLDQAFDKLNLQAKKTTPAFAESGKSAGFLQGQFLKMTAAFASGQIVVDLFHKALAIGRQVMEDSIKSAAEAERVDRSLESAIQIVGRAASVSANSLKGYAKELQRKTVYDDEAIKSSQALIIQMRGTTDEIEAETRGAIGLAQVFSMDLASAARAVAQGYEGNYRALQMLIPEVKQATTEGEKYAAMIAGLDRYYKMAEAATGTYSATTAQLKNAYDELLTSIGDFVVKNPEVIAALEGVKNIMLFLSEYIPRNSKLLANLANLIPGMSGLRDIFLNIAAAGAVAEASLNALNKREKEGEQVAKGLWAGMVKNADGMKVFGISVGPVIKNLDDLLIRGKSTGLSALDKSLKDLGIKTLPELRTELENSKNALAQFKAGGGTAAGVIGPLEKKINDLERALEATWPASRRFKESMEAAALSSRTISIEATAASDPLLTLEERLYGVGLAAVIASRGVDQDLINSFNEIRQKAGDAANGVGLILRVNLVNDLRKKRDELREFGKAMPYEEVKKLKEEIAELEKKLAAGTQWDKFADKAKKAMAGIRVFTDAAVSGMDAIFVQAQRNKEIAIENEYKKRLAAINANVKDEDARQKAVIALEAEFQIKRTAARAAGAKQQKAIALMEAIVNTASAIVEALPNIPLAILVGALGAIQVGLIAKQPIPLARGAVFTKPTLLSAQTYEVAEAGEPEIVSPKSAIRDAVREAIGQLMPQGAFAGAGGSYTINFKGPLIVTNAVLSEAEVNRASGYLFRAVDREAHRRGGRLL